MKEKRVESVKKIKNRNEQKRKNRLRLKEAKIWERVFQARLQAQQEQQIHPEVRKRQAELKVQEEAKEKNLAQLKQRASTQKCRRDANPSLVATSNGQRLKGPEKKVAEEKKRLDLEAQEKRDRDRSYDERHRRKKKCNEDELLVFLLNHTTTVQHISNVESSLKDIIATTKLLDRHPAVYLLELGVIDALFGCLQRFTIGAEDWLHLLSLQVITELTRALYDAKDERCWLCTERLKILRSTYVQLSNHNACQYVVAIAEKHSNITDVVEECVELWYRLTRFHNHLYRPTISTGNYLETFSNPNIVDACRHPRIEQLVIRLFNEHEPKSSTFAFVKHCLALFEVFASNDVTAAYRPEMCDIVMMCIQKYAGNSVVLTICKCAIAALSRNVDNKTKLDALLT
jgi:hypothetical protein